MAKKTHPGSCHCGVVKFEADLDTDAGGSMCNCSICTKLGAYTALGKPADLRVLAGESELSMYEWGSKVGQRYFCKHCGVSCFGRGDIPELGGAYVSVSLRALDDIDPPTLPTVHWDGRHNNWQSGTRPQHWPIQA